RPIASRPSPACTSRRTIGIWEKSRWNRLTTVSRRRPSRVCRPRRSTSFSRPSTGRCRRPPGTLSAWSPIGYEVRVPA
ncbi:hypothetical protein HMPREF0175_0484, partial [Bifidobacterium longum subsp. longum ATCC 55813]